MTIHCHGEWSFTSFRVPFRPVECNKDALFARVMSFQEDADALLDAPLERLGRHMVRHVLVSHRERGADPLLRIAFAPLHGDHGDVLRANFRAQVTERLAERLTGADRGVRAELAVAALLGLGVMFGIARGSELRAMPVDDVADRYGPTIQAHLDGAGDGPGGASDHRG
jgi:hypothetical protein